MENFLAICSKCGAGLRYPVRIGGKIYGSSCAEGYLGIKDIPKNFTGDYDKWKAEKESKRLAEIERNNTFFQFGKYEGQKFSDCTDVKYLVWYFNNGQARNGVLNRVNELAPNEYILTDYGRLITQGESLMNEARNQIESGEIELTAVSNFVNKDPNGSYMVVRVDFEPTTEGLKLLKEKNKYGYPLNDINTYNLNLKKRYYNGNTFYVPEGMKSFKGTKIKLNAELNELELIK
jgi:uncharacterized protein (DUF3820 family)